MEHIKLKHSDIVVLLYFLNRSPLTIYEIHKYLGDKEALRLPNLISAGLVKELSGRFVITDSGEKCLVKIGFCLVCSCNSCDCY